MSKFWGMSGWSERRWRKFYLKKDQQKKGE